MIVRSYARRDKNKMMEKGKNIKAKELIKRKFTHVL